VKNLQNVAYSLFETQLGWCGLAWNEPESLLILLQLPEATPALTEAKIVQNCRARKVSTPLSAISWVISRISRHLMGDLQDFLDIPIDIERMGLFAQYVYAAARTVQAGLTMTYGELAKAINRPKACRAVGQALGRNPLPLIIPCHRILAAGNRPGGFSAYGGPAIKAQLLAIEGVFLPKNSYLQKK